MFVVVRFRVCFFVTVVVSVLVPVPAHFFVTVTVVVPAVLRVCFFAGMTVVVPVLVPVTVSVPARFFVTVIVIVVVAYILGDGGADFAGVARARGNLGILGQGAEGSDPHRVGEVAESVVVRDEGDVLMRTHAYAPLVFKGGGAYGEGARVAAVVVSVGRVKAGEGFGDAGRHDSGVFGREPDVRVGAAAGILAETHTRIRQKRLNAYTLGGASQVFQRRDQASFKGGADGEDRVGVRDRLRARGLQLRAVRGDSGVQHGFGGAAALHDGGGDGGEREDCRGHLRRRVLGGGGGGAEGEDGEKSD